MAWSETARFLLDKAVRIAPGAAVGFALFSEVTFRLVEGGGLDILPMLGAAACGGALPFAACGMAYIAIKAVQAIRGPHQNRSTPKAADGTFARLALALNGQWHVQDAVSGDMHWMSPEDFVEFENLLAREGGWLIKVTVSENSVGFVSTHGGKLSGLTDDTPAVSHLSTQGIHQIKNAFYSDGIEVTGQILANRAVGESGFRIN